MIVDRVYVHILQSLQAPPVTRSEPRAKLAAEEAALALVELAAAEAVRGLGAAVEEALALALL